MCNTMFYIFKLGDSVGEATALMNISDLRKIMGLDNSLSSNAEATLTDTSELTDNQTPNEDVLSRTDSLSSTNSRHFRVRRQSMEQLDLIKVFFRFCFALIFILRNNPKLIIRK